MSDAHGTDATEPDPAEAATETAAEAKAKAQHLIDKAKDAAADIDVHAIVEKAKDTAATVKDKSVDAAATVKEKVSGFVGENEDKIDSAIEKTGHFVDDKLTRNKFSDKIDKAQEVAKDAVHKVGAAGNDAPAPADVAAAVTPDAEEE